MLKYPLTGNMLQDTHHSSWQMNKTTCHCAKSTCIYSCCWVLISHTLFWDCFSFIY